MTIAAALRFGAQRLRGIADSPRLEARLLLAHALGATTEDLIRAPDTVVPTTEYVGLLERRLRHEPIAHLTGRREFWSLDLEVSPASLIPRPDSETVVAAALEVAAAPAQVLDLGTGTGCLLLAILTERPTAWGVGVDKVWEAVALARRNAARCRLADRAAFIQDDWAASVDARFDLVVANPPYVPSREVATLMPEVARFEPASALDGGPDGLDAYRLILARLPHLLSPTGHAVLEVGFGQADDVAALAATRGMAVKARTDLAGTPRALILTLLRSRTAIDEKTDWQAAAAALGSDRGGGRRSGCLGAAVAITRNDPIRSRLRHVTAETTQVRQGTRLPWGVFQERPRSSGRLQPESATAQE